MPQTIVELENGNIATLRDPALLTNGQRRPIVVASRGQQIDPLIIRELQTAVAMKDQKRQDDLLAVIGMGVDPEVTLKIGEVAIVVLVESWTLSLTLPIENATYDDHGVIAGSPALEELSAWDYDRLQIAVATLLPALRWSGGQPAGKVSRSSRPSRRR